MEFYRDRKKRFAYGVYRFEKAYDKAHVEVRSSCLEKKDIPFEHIRVIRDMYERAKMRVRTSGGDSEDFHNDIGLH